MVKETEILTVASHIAMATSCHAISARLNQINKKQSQHNYAKTEANRLYTARVLRGIIWLCHFDYNIAPIHLSLCRVTFLLLSQCVASRRPLIGSARESTILIFIPLGLLIQSVVINSPLNTRSIKCIIAVCHEYMYHTITDEGRARQGMHVISRTIPCNLAAREIMISFLYIINFQIIQNYPSPASSSNVRNACMGIQIWLPIAIRIPSQSILVDKLNTTINCHNCLHGYKYTSYLIIRITINQEI